MREDASPWIGAGLSGNYWRFNACRSPSPAVRAAVVGPSMVRSAIVMEMMAMETVGHEYRAATKQRAIEPRVPPKVRLGIGI